jgi:hypothetical protein
LLESNEGHDGIYSNCTKQNTGPKRLAGFPIFARKRWSIAGWRRAQLCDPQTRLTSGEPITLKKIGSAIGAFGQGLERPREMPFVGGHDRR